MIRSVESMVVEALGMGVRAGGRRRKLAGEVCKLKVLRRVSRIISKVVAARYGGSFEEGQCVLFFP